MARKTIQKTNKAKRGGNKTRKQSNKGGSKPKSYSIKCIKEVKDAKKQFPTVVSLIDKLAKKNIIHANKAANIKSKLARFVASL